MSGTNDQDKDFLEWCDKTSDTLSNMTMPEGWELLPRDPNYHNPHQRHCLHRGQVLSNMFLAVNCEEHWAQFRARPSDIIVASFPKSGTTWLQEIVWRVVHGERGAGSEDGKTLEYRFPLLETPSQGFMPMRSIHEMEAPRLLKTHRMYNLLPGGLPSSGAKILYISRDVRDVCVSYYYFARMVNYEMYRSTFQDFRKSFQAGEIMFGPYREHVKGYLEHADTVLCLTYEQLHSDRAEVVRKVANFLGRTLTDADVEDIVNNTSFGVMKKNPATNFRQWEDAGFAVKEEGTFMRKGKVGDWTNYFTEDESDDFMKWRSEPV